MNKNVKVIASLVRKSKKKLLQNKREEALELMRKAINVDDNSGILVQVIQAIGRKTLITEPENQQMVTPVVPSVKHTDPELLVTPVVPVEKQTEPEPVEVLEEAWTVEEQPEEEPVEVLEEAWAVEEQPEEEPVEVLEEAWAVEEQPEEEPVEVLEEAWAVEERPVEKPEPETKAMENNQERKKSMASEDQLNKLFEASDREYDNGNQQKAIAYLKRARKLDPDNSEVHSRIDLLKTKIKSANLIQMARKRLALGETTRAITIARQAFSMKPDSAGLDELLSDLENMPGIASSESEASNSRKTQSNASNEYITQIRDLVQNNSLEKAASVAEEAFNIFPNDELVMEFVDNFKKLGLLE